MSGGRSKGSDEMFCRTCGEAIKKEAAICPECGVATDGTPNSDGRHGRSNATATAPNSAGTVGGGSGTAEANPAGVNSGGAGAGGTDTAVGGPDVAADDSPGMFHDALRYPGRGQDAFERLFISSVLGLFSWLLLPLVFLAGYCGRILRTTADGVDSPPAFNDGTGLLVSGLTVFAVTVVFFAIPAALFGVGAWVGSMVDSALLVGGSGVGTLALFVGVTYVYPAVLTDVLSAEGLSAFSPDRVGRVVLSRSYFGAWIVGFVIAVGGGTVSLLSGVFFLFIPFFGLFLGFIAFGLIASYTSLSAFRAFGIAYRRSVSAR